MSIKKIHGHSAPATTGHTIPWASFYDPAVRILSLGKAQALRKATVELAQIQAEERVLDVGCGTGDLTMTAKALAGPSGEVYGTDASPQMIERARQKAARAGVGVTFLLDLIENMTFPDSRFDVVLSSLTMHHLPDGLKRAGLAEIYRVLKPGGRILIVDIESSPGGSMVKRFSELMIQLHGGHTAMRDNVKKLIPFVEDAGFTDVESDKIDRQFSFIRAKKESLF